MSTTFTLCARNAAAALVGVALLTGACRAQQSSNLGFEQRDARGRPVGWYVGGDGFEIVTDSVAPLAGTVSLRTRWTGVAPCVEKGPKFAVATQAFPVALAAGRKLHLSGYIRTENIQTGFVGFWMRVD